MNLHGQLRSGLGALDTTSPIVTLNVDSVEIEMPLDIKVTGETNSAPYRSVWVKPPVQPLGVKSDSRSCRMRIRWNITYAK